MYKISFCFYLSCFALTDLSFLITVIVIVAMFCDAMDSDSSF